MIRPKKMSFVRIIGSNNKLKQVIETLYELRLLHLIDFKKSDDGFLETGKPFEEASLYSEKLVKARSMLSYFDIEGEPGKIEKIKEAHKRFSKIEKEFRRLGGQMEKASSDEARLMDLLNHPMAVLGISLKNLGSMSSVRIFAGKTKTPVDKSIEGSIKDYKLVQKEKDGEFYIALAVRNSDGEKAQSMLSDSGFTEYKIVNDVNAKRLRKDLNLAAKRKMALEKELKLLKERNYKFLLDYEFTLSQLNEKAEVPLRFASTQNVFVATGWIPEEKFSYLNSEISKTAKGKIGVESLNQEVEPPVVLENPKPAKPFEFLLMLYSLPKYYEIDPTFLIFLTFPLFFGFMLGDVGYGLITLLMSFVLLKKLGSGGRPLALVMAISSLATILFGFVFGEFFGYGFLSHPLMNRIENVFTMLTISIYVGIAQVTLGFILGFVNELSKGGLKHAIFAKASWMLLEFGALLLAYTYLTGSKALMLPGAIMASLSMPLLIKGEGVTGIVEMPTLLSNVLSYTRLYAFGLASVALAAIINNSTFGLISKGGVNIILGIGVLLMGHLLNLSLGLLGTFLQALRLHYVEFFTKFYKGGGYGYSPFGSVKIERR